MELDITRFFYDADPSDYSASAMELGDNVGTITWRAAQRAEFKLLTTADQCAAFRQYIKGFGAWDAAEIKAMSDNDLNALCIQFVSSNMREGAIDLGQEITEEDWARYERNAERGTVSGNIYRFGTRVYFNMAE